MLHHNVIIVLNDMNVRVILSIIYMVRDITNLIRDGIDRYTQQQSVPLSPL